MITPELLSKTNEASCSCTESDMRIALCNNSLLCSNSTFAMKRHVATWKALRLSLIHRPLGHPDRHTSSTSTKPSRASREHRDAEICGKQLLLPQRPTMVYDKGTSVGASEAWPGSTIVLLCVSDPDNAWKTSFDTTSTEHFGKTHIQPSGTHIVTAPLAEAPNSAPDKK